jgi:hypothetical protein
MTQIDAWAAGPLVVFGAVCALGLLLAALARQRCGPEGGGFDAEAEQRETYSGVWRRHLQRHRRRRRHAGDPPPRQPPAAQGPSSDAIRPGFD